MGCLVSRHERPSPKVPAKPVYDFPYVPSVSFPSPLPPPPPQPQPTPTTTGALYVAAIDFGTTFSGCAFAKREDGTIACHYNWPGQVQGGGKPYCKTLTSLLYERLPSGEYEMREWGWNARIKFIDMQTGAQGGPLFLVERFKLHLADSKEQAAAPPLPEGLTVRRVIVDFLRALGDFTMKRLENMAGHLSPDDVQWCLTVPSQWTDRAKQLMKSFAVDAGMVSPTSVHPILIILEPEAASIYSQRKLLNDNHINLSENSEDFLVVDAGGGTVDLVLHKTDPKTHRIMERASSEGGLCGSTYVDMAFINYLCRVFPFFRQFVQAHPQEAFDIRKQFEILKCSFGLEETSYRLNLPRRMGDMLLQEDSRLDPYSFTIPLEDVKKIFDETVDKILELIAGRLEKVPTCRRILVVGGFAGSEYLLQRIRHTFGPTVGGAHNVVSPAEPGASVVQGAVMYGLREDLFLSRVARRTYGIRSSKLFTSMDPPEFRFWDRSGSVHRCKNVFEIYVHSGDEVPTDSKVSRIVSPVDSVSRLIDFTVVSSTERDPKYTTDPSVKVESKCVIAIEPGANYSVHMYFGRSSVEVEAVPVQPGQGGGTVKNISIPLVLEEEAVGELKPEMTSPSSYYNERVGGASWEKSNLLWRQSHDGSNPALPLPQERPWRPLQEVPSQRGYNRVRHPSMGGGYPIS